MDRQASPWVVQPLVITSDDMHVHLEDDVLVLAKEVGVSRQPVPLPVTLYRQMCMRFDTKSARSHTPTLGSVPGEGGRPADDQPVRTALHASRSDGIPMAFRWHSDGNPAGLRALRVPWPSPTAGGGTSA